MYSSLSYVHTTRCKLLPHTVEIWLSWFFLSPCSVLNYTLRLCDCWMRFKCHHCHVGRLFLCRVVISVTFMYVFDTVASKSCTNNRKRMPYPFGWMFWTYLDDIQEILKILYHDIISLFVPSLKQKQMFIVIRQNNNYYYLLLKLTINEWGAWSHFLDSFWTLHFIHSWLFCIPPWSNMKE